jgi:hypothetical protein
MIRAGEITSGLDAGMKQLTKELAEWQRDEVKYEEERGTTLYASRCVFGSLGADRHRYKLRLLLDPPKQAEKALVTIGDREFHYAEAFKDIDTSATVRGRQSIPSKRTTHSACRISSADGNDAGRTRRCTGQRGVSCQCHAQLVDAVAAVRHGTGLYAARGEN